MKVNKNVLKQLIQEELTAVLSELNLDEKDQKKLSPKQQKLALTHDNPPPGQEGDEEIDAKDLAALRNKKD